MKNEIARPKVILDGKQAEQELENLTAKAKKFRDAMMEAAAAGDSQKEKRLQQQLKATTTEIRNLKKEAFDVDRVLKNINGASFNELSQAVRKATNDLKKMQQTDPGYGAQKDKVVALKTKMAELNNEQKANTPLWGRMAEGANKYFSIITAAVASFAGVVLGLKQVVQSFNDYEERVDNLSALTGLAGENLDWLSQKAKDLSTSTLEGGIRVKQGAQEIVDAFTKTGSARPELLKNKEALSAVTEESIILANAAKTDLQPAIEGLTMVMNQYNAPATEARRIINSLAAGSKEGAGEIPYLTQAFEKAGTVAADAGISIETLVATIETLAPRITQPEIAGRSLKNVILELQNGADDTNPAIVGLSTALENLGKQNLSVTQLTKRFGTENITTAKILINNVGELKRYEAAVTGTNVALEQAAINTDNNNAKLAQAKNRINVVAIALGEKLSPAMTLVTGYFGKSLSILSVLVDVVTKYSGIIITSTVAIVSYTLAVKLLTFWETRNNEAKGIGLVLTKAQALTNATLRAATLLLSAAQALFTGNTLRAAAAMRLFNTTVKLNPVGLVITLLATAAAAFIAFADDVAKTTKEQRKFNDELERSGELMGQSKSLDERAKVMNTMNKRQLDELKGSIASQITVEEDFHSKLLQSAKKAVDEDTKLKEIQQERQKDGLSAFQKEMLDIQVKYRKRDIIRDLQDQENASKARLAQLKKHQADAIKLSSKFPKTDSENPTDPESKDLVSKALDLAHATELLRLKQYYADKEQLEKEYKARLLASELAYLQTKESLEPNQLKKIELQSQIIDKQLQYAAALKETVPELLKNSEEIGKLNLRLFEEAKLLGLATKKQNDATDATEELKEKTEMQRDIILDTADAMAQSIFDLAAGGEDALREAGKNILLFALDMLKMQAQIAIAGATIQSLAQPDSVATFGATGLIRAAILAGLIEVAFAGVKGLVSGAFDSKGKKSGGYAETDPSDDTPMGVYHANEFIGNAKSVRNPTVKKVYDIVRLAQEDGTISTLNLPAVMAATGMLPTGKQSGGYASPSTRYAAQGATSPELAEGRIPNEQLTRMNTLLEKLIDWDPKIAIETYERKRENWKKITSGGLK